ncbi:MAG TPA: peptidylprolyl isomerase [Candidatus Acidoferrum sp.]|nr:peptidylprolyl isomerase [Candidatus Acidoferrum sp.]
MKFELSRGRSALAAFCALLALSTLAGFAQTNGIFADFTTSMGNFTCTLDYTNAPRTSANFIGLVTGQRAWVDPVTGRARTNAFYDGLIFHRVIAGFMDQGGSPTGLGDGGPGYAIMDEFSPALVFTNFGVLAMANSGPNSDGSQFFITVASYTFGNSNYTIFGKVVSGSNVVWAINQVATDANNKPLTNVVMQQVSIRRVGTAAQAFNISTQALPVVINLPLHIASTSNAVTLTFTNRQYADNELYSTTNLLGTWGPTPLGIEITAPTTNTFPQAKATPQCFYRLAQIQYASSTFAPKNLYGRTLATTFLSGGSGTVTITFDNAGGGTFVFPPNPAASLTSYSWSQQPYRGFVLLLFPGYPALNLTCNFTAGGSGSFTGTAYPYYPFTVGAFGVSGTFTLSGS